MDRVTVQLTDLINEEFECHGPEIYFPTKKDLTKFESSDSVILPKHFSTKLFESSMSFFSVKIISKDRPQLEDYGKVTYFDAPHNIIIIPHRMMSNMSLVDGDKIRLQTIHIPQITEITFRCDKSIKNPVPVIEFELRNHSISYIGKIIVIKIFDKEFILQVTKQSPANICQITNLDINLTIEQ